MTSLEIKTFQTNDQRAKLRDTLNNEQIQRYIDRSGPLSIAELPDELRVSDAFREFANVYGWPSKMNAGTIQPIHEYADATDFWLNIYEPTSSEKGLNNFKEWLRYAPLERADAGKSISEKVYATKPALQRAYVIAAPLFESLRDVVDVDSDPERVVKEYPEVAEAAYATYKLLGRLLTKDDMRLQMSHITGRPSRDPDVVDAHVTLTE